MGAQNPIKMQPPFGNSRDQLAYKTQVTSIQIGSRLVEGFDHFVDRLVLVFRSTKHLQRRRSCRIRDRSVVLGASHDC
jgi:hypothetical protein